MDIDTARQLLDLYDACAASLKWVRNNTSVQNAWEQSPYQAWNYWLVIKLSEDPGVINPVELYLNPMLKVAREIIAKSGIEDPTYEAFITKYAAFYEQGVAAGKIDHLAIGPREGAPTFDKAVTFGVSAYADEACRRIATMTESFLDTAVPRMYLLQADQERGEQQDARGHKRFVRDMWPAIEACLERAAFKHGLIQALPSKET